MTEECIFKFSMLLSEFAPTFLENAIRWRIQLQSDIMMKETEAWIWISHLIAKDRYECPVCGYSFDKQYTACPDCGSTLKTAGNDPSWVDEMETIEAILDD